MDNNLAFVESIRKEIIEPGVQQLMDSRYFRELREGSLSRRKLQGFALQHYIHNVHLLKGLALCMIKNAHNPELYNLFLYGFNEEQSHPGLAKRFGLAIGLTEEDFADATPVFECLAHTSAVIRGMYLGTPAETRAGALVNESMVCRYSEEFNTYLRKNYQLGDEACEFFSVHAVADQHHTALAAKAVAQYCKTDRDRRLVRESAENMTRFKLAKFEGIYNAYA